MRVCVRVCACVRACVRACMYVSGVKKCWFLGKFSVHIISMIPNEIHPSGGK